MKVSSVVFSFLVMFTAVIADDLSIVKRILAENDSLKWDVSKLIKEENGRIVELNLNNVDFSRTGITKITPKISELTELRVLHMNDNDIMSLPDGICALTKLEVLTIASNSLYSLPDGIGNLSNLKELDVRNNQLKTIPPSIGNLKKLTKLQLWGNNFKTLPVQIGELTALRELYLKGNKLVSLPLEITKLKLVYLDVLDNKLCNVTGAVDKWLKKYDDEYKKLQKCLGDKRFQ